MGNTGEKLSQKKRQALIIDFISKGNVTGQKMLGLEFAKHGYDVSQATISRDIKKLGIEKEGEVYVLGSKEVLITHHQGRIRQVFGDDVQGILSTPRTIAIKTRPGYAGSTAMFIKEIIGDRIFSIICGEDSILIVVDEKHFKEFEADLARLVRL